MGSEWLRQGRVGGAGEGEEELCNSKRFSPFDYNIEQSRDTLPCRPPASDPGSPMAPLDQGSDGREGAGGRAGGKGVLLALEQCSTFIS